MKRVICGLMAALLSVSAISNAGEPAIRAVSERSVMAYFSVPVGLTRGRQQLPSFGLRLQQSTPFGVAAAGAVDGFAPASRRGRRTLQGAGVMMLDSFDSGGGSFAGRPWLMVLAVAGGRRTGLHPQRDLRRWRR